MRSALIIIALSLCGCKNPLVVKEYLNLVSISPNHGATQVAVDVQIIAGFSEPLAPASVDSQTAYLVDADASPVVATATYEAGAHWIILDPEADLQPDTTYVVTFTPEIEGEVTGHLLAPVQTRFTTAGSHPSNALPIADAGADQTVSIGQTAILDGSASEDLEDATLSFSWRLVSAPANSAVGLSTATGTITEISPDVTGEFVLGLTVNDGVQDSSEDFVVVRALGSAPDDTGVDPDTGSSPDTGDSSI